VRVKVLFIETNVSSNEDFPGGGIVAFVGFAVFIVAKQESWNGFGVEFLAFTVKNVTICYAAYDAKVAQVGFNARKHLFKCFEF
jgi:hypothetical protein